MIDAKKKALEEAMWMADMIIVGYENERDGWPEYDRIHKCKSCYDQAIVLRDALKKEKP